MLRRAVPSLAAAAPPLPPKPLLNTTGGNRFVRRDLGFLQKPVGCDEHFKVEKMATPAEAHTRWMIKAEDKGVTATAWLCLFGLVVQNTSVVLATRYATAVRGDGTPFAPSALVVITEFGKMLVSLFIVHRTEPGGVMKVVREVQEHPRCCMKCCVPAGLYTLSSIGVYYAVGNLEPTLFQICNQGKMPTLALFSMMWLGRTFSRRKWISLFVLSFGILLCSGVSGTNKSSRPQSFALGIGAVATVVASSSFAGVYFEGLLKTDKRAKETSLWMRNVFLSIFSMLFGMPMFLSAEWGDITQRGGTLQAALDVFTKGVDHWAWIIIALQIAGGLLVALSIKHADSVMKSCATAVAIVACGVISHLFFAFVPGPLFFPGATLVIGATITYSQPDPPGLPHSPEPKDKADVELSPSSVERRHTSSA